MRVLFRTSIANLRGSLEIKGRDTREITCLTFFTKDVIMLLRNILTAVFRPCLFLNGGNGESLSSGRVSRHFLLTGSGCRHKGRRIPVVPVDSRPPTLGSQRPGDVFEAAVSRLARAGAMRLGRLSREHLLRPSSFTLKAAGSRCVHT